MQDVVDEFAPVKAVKSQVKLKLGISGPSGSGKTDGALALATLFGADDPTRRPKILVVDTENRSASLYADRYDFDTIPLKAPYTPERYKRAMYKAIEGGYDWLIVDTISHEWDAEGGILRQKDKLDLVANSNSYTNWAKLTPDHESFVEFLKQIPVNTICTMRSKQAYVLETDSRGKQKPRKIGMAPVQRDGVEYEFTLIFDLDMAHNAIPSKNRTTLFADDPVDLRKIEVAQELRRWLEHGAVVAPADWKPELGTRTIHASGREETVPTAQQRRPPAHAQKPDFITQKQKQDFWVVARQHNKSDEDVRVYLHETFRIGTTAEIPAEHFATAIDWAKTELPERKMAEGEERARDAARSLGVSEPDLQYELVTCRGDWNAVFEILSRRADEEEAAALLAEEASVR